MFRFETRGLFRMRLRKGYADPTRFVPGGGQRGLQITYALAGRILAA
jgi:hypothetical protein